MDQPAARDMQVASLGELLDAIAARTPTPGGGAVTALVATLAAALAGMVASFSLGRKDLAGQEAEIREDVQRLERLRAVALELAAEDAAAFELVSAAMKRPKEDPDRAEAMSSAAVAAVSVPQALIATCCEALRLLEAMTARSNRNLRSDLAIAAVLAEAAARASRLNVAINVPLLPEDRRAAALPETDALLAVAAELARSVQARCV